MYFCDLAIPNKNKTLRTNLYLSGSYKTWSQGPVRLFIQEIAPPYSVPFCPENRPTLQRALLYRKSPYPRLSHFIQEIAPPLNMPFYPENRATLQHSVFPYDEWDNASQLYGTDGSLSQYSEKTISMLLDERDCAMRFYTSSFYFL